MKKEELLAAGVPAESIKAVQTLHGKDLERERRKAETKTESDFAADLDEISNQLEFGLDTLKAINIAMTEGGTVLSENVLYVTLNFLLEARNSLRQAIDGEYTRISERSGKQ